MGRSGRLFLLLRPYTLLFVGNLVATFVASVTDGATFVLLIPFLRALFGQQALPAVGGSTIETLVAKVAGPLLATGAPQTALRTVVLVLLGALVVKNAAGYAAAMSSVAIEEGVVRDLRVRLFRHLQRLPLGFFQRTRGGQLLARIISDTDQVKTAVTAALASFVRNANLIVVYVAILFGLSWRLTLIALVLAPLLVLIIRPIVARVRRRSREQAEDRGELTSLVSEMVASVKLVRAYVAVALRLMSPVKAVAQYPTIMAGAAAAADRVFEVLDLPAGEGDTPGAAPARFHDRIEYRGVSFSYNGEAPVLQDVQLEVRRGQVVAIVGPSGAGKTTLVDLLPRFYEPTRGDILMDGAPIARFTRTSLRGLMGIVSQETILLNDTVLA